MASPNINLRDPVLYRIVHAAHPRTGDAWCIYPTYDFAHGQSDAIEGVTHSICTLEFEAHRPLYDWLIEHLPVPSRPAPVRVRPAQPDLHRPLQAGPPAPRQRGPRARLGRPPDADDLGPAPARLPGRGDPRLRRHDRRGQDGQRRSRSASSSTRCATCSTGRRRGASRSSIPSRWSSRTTPRARSRRWTSPTTRRTRRPGRGRSRSRASCGSSATTSWRSRRRSSSASRPGREVRLRSAYFVTCREVVKDAAGRGRRAALHLRPGHPRRRRARRPTAEGDPALGVGGARRAGRGPPVRPPVQRARSRAPTAATSSPTSTRRPRRCSAAACVEPSLADVRGRRDRPVRAARLLLPRPRLSAGGARLQPDADAQGHLGEGPGPGHGTTRGSDRRVRGPREASRPGRPAARRGVAHAAASSGEYGQRFGSARSTVSDGGRLSPRYAAPTRAAIAMSPIIGHQEGSIGKEVVRRRRPGGVRPVPSSLDGIPANMVRCYQSVWHLSQGGTGSLGRSPVQPAWTAGPPCRRPGPGRGLPHHRSGRPPGAETGTTRRA